jgi:hypothetical protein
MHNRVKELHRENIELQNMSIEAESEKLKEDAEIHLKRLAI